MQRQCAETACILAELGADETIVGSALLKDVLLSSMMTDVQLRNLVSPAVADLVVKVDRLYELCKVRSCHFPAVLHYPAPREVEGLCTLLLLRQALLIKRSQVEVLA